MTSVASIPEILNLQVKVSGDIFVTLSEIGICLISCNPGPSCSSTIKLILDFGKVLIVIYLLLKENFSQD